ncbi:MAG: desulfoferrodoxin [Candidatus Altiarchaeota archaeon]
MPVKEKLEVYKCNVCGNIIEVLTVGGGELVCCGKPMELLAEKTEDAGNEKHVPVIVVEDGKVKVKVSSVAHPMENAHFIQWIEVISGDDVQRKFLNPGGEPEAVFNIEADNVTAREYCNLHGLWKSK